MLKVYRKGTTKDGKIRILVIDGDKQKYFTVQKEDLENIKKLENLNQVIEYLKSKGYRIRGIKTAAKEEKQKASNTASIEKVSSNSKKVIEQILAGEIGILVHSEDNACKLLKLLNTYKVRLRKKPKEINELLPFKEETIWYIDYPYLLIDSKSTFEKEFVLSAHLVK